MCVFGFFLSYSESESSKARILNPETAARLVCVVADDGLGGGSALVWKEVAEEADTVDAESE